MKLTTQKFITSCLICFVVLGGFEALISVLQLNQPLVYLQLAVLIYLYLNFKIVFLFDLHFKKTGSLQRAKIKHQNVVFIVERMVKIYFSALWNRFEHLRKWSYIKKWLHFLLIPAFIFWSVVMLLYVNTGFYKTQQVVALFSSPLLIVYYWYLKEIFHRQTEQVDSDIFIALKVIRICTAGLLFAASMAVLRSYCLDPIYFSAETFCYTFLLLYLLLYQIRKVTGRNIFIALIIALVHGVIGHFVYIYWALNYFSAAVFLTVFYNFLGELFHYYLDKALTWGAFWETLLVTLAVTFMVFSTTNFQSRLKNNLVSSADETRLFLFVIDLFLLKPIHKSYNKHR